MSKKITWDDVYKDFKIVYPNFSKEAIHWHPHSYSTIKIYFTDGRKMLYDYDVHTGRFTT